MAYPFQKLSSIIQWTMPSFGGKKHDNHAIVSAQSRFAACFSMQEENPWKLAVENASTGPTLNLQRYLRSQGSGIVYRSCDWGMPRPRLSLCSSQFSIVVSNCGLLTWPSDSAVVDNEKLLRQFPRYIRAGRVAPALSPL